jgi:hypothetical protein
MDTVRTAGFVFEVEIKLELHMTLGHDTDDQVIPNTYKGLVVSEYADGRDAVELLSLGKVIEDFNLESQVRKMGLSKLLDKFVKSPELISMRKVGSAFMKTEAKAE